MLPKKLIKRLNERRLRGLLALFFLALAVPTGVLVYQAYSQLKWESYHQYRGAAEELTRRIDANLADLITGTDARSYADFAFLNVTGDPAAKFVQRSPLSGYPVADDLAGVIGYFQVDSGGVFSTPLLPPPDADAASLGIGAAEYDERQALAQRIQSILTDNRLIRSRPDLQVRRSLETSFDSPADAMEQETEEREYRNRQAASEEIVVTAARVESPAQAPPEEQQYSQFVFDELNRPEAVGESSLADRDAEFKDDVSTDKTAGGRANRLDNVTALNLDDSLQSKLQMETDEFANREPSRATVDTTLYRTKRREQTALPEAAATLEQDGVDANKTSLGLEINTFESELDPFEFSLLDSGHFVLFRKVWRAGERYIQGALIDQPTFIQSLIGDAFFDTALSDMSDLIVAYNDDVIRTYSGHMNTSYSDLAEEFDGALLYRSRLTSPLNGIDLIFSIRNLPPGPGAGVLGWVTLVLAIVFVGSFTGLYRLGVNQISLAKQQQDFVSAVSHELKTPLTSIRMYGEMLKEGWADEDKRQKYYEFIHDESERLSRLISNVLELAKISRNEPQFSMRPIAVADLMRNVKAKIASQAERAGFELRFIEGDTVGDAVIDIDEDCFAQIVINLVDNAIKFSSGAERKTVEITSKLTRGNDVVIAVRDYGPGIPRDQMQKIFELFYRSGSELTRETVGTGIGLAIVHQLTAAMNGSVDIVNVDPGAEFRLSFRGLPV